MSWKLGNRHGQMLLMFLGLTVAYALRVNLSVGIVAMTNNSSNADFPVMNWTTPQKGAILGSFFWGYFVTQIPGGLLAAKVGPVYVLTGSLLFCGVATVLVPLAAIHGGWIAVEILRIFQGLGQGVIYPTIHTHMSKWTVPKERGSLLSFVFGGTQFGSILMLVSGGVLAASPGGWPSIFYISGGASIAWAIFCAIWGSDSPQKHRTISIKEKAFIEGSLVHNTSEARKLEVPWKRILSSPPFYALILTHMGQNWGFWTLLTLMPTYINGVHGYDIKQNGLLSALPYTAMWGTTFLFGFMGDYFNRNKIIPVHIARKMWNSFSHYGGALALVGVSFTDSAVGAISLLTISVALNSGCYLGYLCNHLDLSPNFAGTLMGITNCIANLSSVLAPQVAGYILTNESDPAQWRIVFLLSAAIFFIGNTIFILFGSTDVQPWNQPEEASKKDSSTALNEH